MQALQSDSQAGYASEDESVISNEAGLSFVVSKGSQEHILGAGEKMKEQMQMNKIAAATAHRVCCGTEHDPQNGKLHGYCVVCGVPWPCETAQLFLMPQLVKK